MKKQKHEQELKDIIEGNVSGIQTSNDKDIMYDYIGGGPYAIKFKL